MHWFTLACGLSGLSMGWLFAPVIAIFFSSLQIWLFLITLWMAAEMDLALCLTWGLVGLFSHQGAYLAGLLTHSRLRGQSTRFLLETDLDMLDEVSHRLERKAPPQLDDEARQLARLAHSLRRTLRRQRLLKTILRRGGGLTV